MLKSTFVTLAAFVGFCGSTIAFADGRMEEARKAFYEVAQKTYVDVVRKLESHNQNAAKADLKQLHGELDRLENPLLYIEKDVGEGFPKLKEKWEPVMTLFG